jgi:hypothetical protein
MQTYTARSFGESELLAVPRLLHVTLTAVTFFLALGSSIASIVLIKAAFNFQSALIAFPLGALAAHMVAMSVTRSTTRFEGPRGRLYFTTFMGIEWPGAGWAIISFFFCALYAANLTSALAHCPDKTIETLCNMTCGGIAVVNVTDWNAIARTPYFGTNIMWQQLCLDNYGETIGMTVIGYIDAVWSLGMLVHLMLLRGNTFKLLNDMRREDEIAQATPEGEETAEEEEEEEETEETSLTTRRTIQT